MHRLRLYSSELRLNAIHFMNAKQEAPAIPCVPLTLCVCHRSVFNISLTQSNLQYNTWFGREKIAQCIFSSRRSVSRKYWQSKCSPLCKQKMHKLWTIYVTQYKSKNTENMCVTRKKKFVLFSGRIPRIVFVSIVIWAQIYFIPLPKP